MFLTDFTVNKIEESKSPLAIDLTQSCANCFHGMVDVVADVSTVVTCCLPEY